MKYKIIIVLMLLSVLLFSCSPALRSQKVVKNNITMLYGEINKAQLYYDYPLWKKGMQDYLPNAEIIKKLSELNRPFEVKLFLATWCPDSKREVPHFFKITNQAGLAKEMTIHIWAVDRHLKLDNDLQAKYGLKRVPTFIFYRKGKEIGRIIESPQAFLLEEDIFNILSKK